MNTSFHLLKTPLETGTTVLEASAGTGKTYALAALVIRLVAEAGIPISKIVITTYTVTATAELRERIRARFSEALDTMNGHPHPKPTPFIADFVAKHTGDGAVKQRIADALRDFDQASISTIHSLCQRILQERTFESGTRPSLEIAPDENALVLETAMDFWRQKFSSPEPGLTPFAIQAGLSPEALAKIYGDAANHPGALVRPRAESPCHAGERLLAVFADFRARWPEWRDSVAAMFGDDAKWAIGNYKKRGITDAKLAQIELLASSPHPPLGAYSATDFFRRSVIQAKGVSKKHPLPENAFTEWCDEFAAVREHYSSALKAEFLGWAESDLASRKSNLGLAAFGDLLSLVGSALAGKSGEALTAAIQSRYSAALVDEFQDTDPIQADIFVRLFSKSPQRLFLIGDPKQAIYSFRGADLFTYLRVTSAADRTYRLDTNHRSDAVLVSAVNTLFSKPAQPFIDERIQFAAVKSARSADARPLRFDDAPRPAMRFCFWDAGDEDIAGVRADKELPGIVASEIVRTLSTGTLDGRPLMPRDCAALCRSNVECQSVQAALAARNVPAVVLSAASVFASDEAAELALILHAIANPAREAGIRAALATRLMGFDAAALDRLTTAANEWESIIARFHEPHRIWIERGFLQMFNAFAHSWKMRERLLALPQGDRRLTNLLHLAELLHGAVSELQFGVDSLLRWLARQIAEKSKAEANELRLERDDDAVKILTIHKSKGLEWPVVFCPFLWRKADGRTHSLPVFHDDKDRAVIDLGTDEYAHAETQWEHELLAEHLRLLYVALTRARHECHVVWGRFNLCENSGLMWLLESPAHSGTDAPSALKTRADALTPTMMKNTLLALAESAPELFSVVPLPENSATHFRPHEDSATPGSAQVFHGNIERTWRVSSFTAFTAQRESEDADRDPVARLNITNENRGIHAFPSGMKAGVCLHDIFERVDFANAAGFRNIIHDRLYAHAMFSNDNFDAVVFTMQQIVNASLLPGLKLASVPFHQTIRELEFHLPSALITPADLSQFTESGLIFEPRKGVLKGFVDLVFEHDGRFHILDWKSNRLGSTAEDYTAGAMWSEIAHHRYELQWQLYTLALHRYLRSRLGRDYDPARHLGTVFYVFIRGVDSSQPELGIHRAELDLVALKKLDALFSGT